MLVIGITGGIGSGKSSVAKIIQEAGYKVISTDDKAKEIMVTDLNVKQKLIEAFGDESFLFDGTLNKSYISSQVFGETEIHQKNLIKLNSITHPTVIEFMINQVKFAEESGENLIFVESALIYEANLQDGFDYIIVVYSDKNPTLERISKRTGLTQNQIELIMNQQINPVEKKSLADFVIENNDSLEELKKSTLFILEIIKSLTL